MWNFSYINRNQGIFALWRGNLANCLRYVPKFALDMSLKTPIRGFFNELIIPGTNHFLHLITKWLSGSLAAMDYELKFLKVLVTGNRSDNRNSLSVSSMICYPLDFARTKLAMDLKKDSLYSGIIDCWKRTIKEKGLLSIYDGLSICLVGEVIYRGTKYALYDFFQVRFHNL